MAHPYTLPKDFISCPISEALPADKIPMVLKLLADLTFYAENVDKPNVGKFLKKYRETVIGYKRKNRRINGYSRPNFSPKICPCGIEFMPTNNNQTYHDNKCYQGFYRRARQRVNSRQSI